MHQGDDPEIRLRQPETRDAASIWQLVEESGQLDRNSCYLYLLLCRDFAQTCVCAERAGKLVGFVTAYRTPVDPRTIFVWQIAVGAEARRQGLALRMLRFLLDQQAKDTAYVEATIAASNVASRRLFESLAQSLSVPLTDLAGFAEGDFPSLEGQHHHEAEPRIRIGPLPSR